ncbi:MAG: DinB family protein [Anaerolineae bacterium]|jgi:hypothetical protein|nr:DinB family protein [Anaerolineae bacterium]MBT7075473.1 DinB family protein [Anaerolineae bacterium]MBT7782540.1 DinB family protein [Anaerolineae bacterium]
MPKSPQFLAKRLRAEGEKMTTYFKKLNDDDWARTIYTEGGEWTIRNVLAHFVTAEQAFLKLFPSIVDGGEGVSKEFDIDRYNARQQEKTEKLSPSELLFAFEDVRAKMAEWVETLNEEDLEKEGRHPFLEETIVEEMIKLVYMHNQLHYRDMRKSIRK